MPSKNRVQAHIVAIAIAMHVEQGGGEEVTLRAVKGYHRLWAEQLYRHGCPLKAAGGDGEVSNNSRPESEVANFCTIMYVSRQRDLKARKDKRADAYVRAFMLSTPKDQFLIQDPGEGVVDSHDRLGSHVTGLPGVCAETREAGSQRPCAGRYRTRIRLKA
ncbi:hypothetical protein FOCC_FOCC014281 [Frankliniella occidentalis]|nr:hypothetical protein FOCC_FOCC014281 [Frankliniella occidentalis]